jgi:DNA-directed RNA polymerase subunit RPC12/RpoP
VNKSKAHFINEIVEKEFLNFYKCPECGKKWKDTWSSMVDNTCPSCGIRNISPYKSVDTRDFDDEE